MPYPLYLSLRYLKARPIAYLATVVVCLSVASVIVVLAVLRGLQETIIQNARSIHADLVISSSRGRTIPHHESVLEKIGSLEPVESCAPELHQFALIETSRQQSFALLRGIPMDPRDPTLPLARILPEQKTHGLQVGAKLMEDLLLEPGEEVVLYAPTYTPLYLAGSRLPTIGKGTFRVEGSLVSWDYMTDHYTILLPLGAMQKLLRQTEPPGASRIQVRLRPGHPLEPVAALVEKTLGDSFFVRTWKEMNQQLAEFQAVENKIMAVILSFTILACGFAIFAMLAMLVKEKTRDIGILNSLGAGKVGIATTFLLCGAWIGTIGGAMGAWLGVSFCRRIQAIEAFLQQRLHLDFYFREAYYLKEIPVSSSLAWAWEVALFAALICVLSSLVPAWKAAGTDPIQTLRYE
jgi:lipoprotein-releasing system permease protein